MGYIKEIRYAGENIDMYMLEDGLYWSPNDKAYIAEAWKFLKRMHSFLNDDITVIWANHGILAEAYVNAVLDWNGNGETSMIPSNALCWFHLRKLVSRYLKAGYVLSDHYLDAIFK